MNSSSFICRNFVTIRLGIIVLCFMGCSFWFAAYFKSIHSIIGDCRVLKNMNYVFDELCKFMKRSRNCNSLQQVPVVNSKISWSTLSISLTICNSLKLSVGPKRGSKHRRSVLRMEWHITTNQNYKVSLLQHKPCPLSVPWQSYVVSVQTMSLMLPRKLSSIIWLSLNIFYFWKQKL